jgi:hypothetical protein
MKWIVLWFTLSGQSIPLGPPMLFESEAACTKFANSRLGMVELLHGRARFECRAFPFVEPKA